MQNRPWARGITSCLGEYFVTVCIHTCSAASVHSREHQNSRVPALCRLCRQGPRLGESLMCLWCSRQPWCGRADCNGAATCACSLCEGAAATAVACAQLAHICVVGIRGGTGQRGAGNIYECCGGRVTCRCAVWPIASHVQHGNDDRYVGLRAAPVFAV